jgi:hypothetical protein
MTDFVAAFALFLVLFGGVWVLLERPLRRTSHLPRLPFGVDAERDSNL